MNWPNRPFIPGCHLSESSSWSPPRFSRWSRWLKSSDSLENTLWPWCWACSSMASEPLPSFSSWSSANYPTDTCSKCRKCWRQLSELARARPPCQSPLTVSTTWESTHVSPDLSSQSVQQSTWTVDRLEALVFVRINPCVISRNCTLRGCCCIVHRSITQHITYFRSHRRCQVIKSCGICSQALNWIFSQCHCYCSFNWCCWHPTSRLDYDGHGARHCWIARWRRYNHHRCRLASVSWP